MRILCSEPSFLRLAFKKSARHRTFPRVVSACARSAGCHRCAAVIAVVVAVTHAIDRSEIKKKKIIIYDNRRIGVIAHFTYTRTPFTDPGHTRYARPHRVYGKAGTSACSALGRCGKRYKKKKLKNTLLLLLLLLSCSYYTVAAKHEKTGIK